MLDVEVFGAELAPGAPPPTVAAPESRRAMLEVEVFGAELAPGAPSPQEVRRLCALAVTTAGAPRISSSIIGARQPRRSADLSSGVARCACTS